MNLSEKRCIPCEKGSSPFSGAEVKELISEIPSWSLKNGHLFKYFKFIDFVEAMDFVNSIACIAEEEGHHPDISIHYNRVELELWTHAVKGLSENDFILAAKIDKLVNVPVAT